MCVCACMRVCVHACVRACVSCLWACVYARVICLYAHRIRVYVHVCASATCMRVSAKSCSFHTKPQSCPGIQHLSIAKARSDSPVPPKLHPETLFSDPSFSSRASSFGAPRMSVVSFALLQVKRRAQSGPFLFFRLGTLPVMYRLVAPASLTTAPSPPPPDHHHHLTSSCLLHPHPISKS